MMKFIRNRKIFAFLQGLYETYRWGSSSGRTHPTDQSWNEWYDRGMNLAEQLPGHN